MTPTEGNRPVNRNRVPLVDLVLSHPPPGWVTQGLCTREEYDFMFPEPPNINHYYAQRKMCRECPVMDLCREYGFDEPHGVWGGLSPKERRLRGGGRGRVTTDGQFMQLAKPDPIKKRVKK